MFFYLQVMSKLCKCIKTEGVFVCGRERWGHGFGKACYGGRGSFGSGWRVSESYGGGGQERAPKLRTAAHTFKWLKWKTLCCVDYISNKKLKSRTGMWKKSGNFVLISLCNSICKWLLNISGEAISQLLYIWFFGRHFH